MLQRGYSSALIGKPELGIAGSGVVAVGTELPRGREACSMLPPHKPPGHFQLCAHRSQSMELPGVGFARQKHGARLFSSVASPPV